MVFQRELTRPTFAFICILVVEICLVNCQYVLNSGAIDREQELIDKLLENYNKKLRPSGTVQVKFALNLNQIIKLVEKDQIFMLNVFVDHEWTDNRLSWNPAEYGNLTVIRISSEYLWTPDTFVYTTADQTGFLLPQVGAYFVVSSKGSIFWPNPLTQMRVRCRMSIAWFPFDDQLCVIVFGSWSYTYTYLNYTLSDEFPSLENYTENNEWSLLQYKPIREEIKYDNWIENDHFSEIRYKILIKRKPLFVLQNFVIPALMLCIITLVTFFVPFAQEMQLGISIMLAFSVFKLRLSDDVPVQSDSIPLINIYFTFCMSFSLSAMIWFSLMNVFKEKKQVPSYIRIFVIKYVCLILCTRNHKRKEPSSSTSFVKKTDAKYNKNDLELESLIIRRPNGPHQNRSNEIGKHLSDIWLPQKKNNKQEDILKINNYSDDIGTQLDITVSESFNNFDQIRNRKDSISSNSSPILYNSSAAQSPIKQPQFVKSSFDNNNNNNNNNSRSIMKHNNKKPLTSSAASKLAKSDSNAVSSTTSISHNNTTTRLDDLEILIILNRFVFLLFLLFIILLNALCLLIFPYIIKVPLVIDDFV